MFAAVFSSKCSDAQISFFWKSSVIQKRLYSKDNYDFIDWNEQTYRSFVQGLWRHMTGKRKAKEPQFSTIADDFSALQEFNSHGDRITGSGSEESIRVDFPIKNKNNNLSIQMVKKYSYLAKFLFLKPAPALTCP